MSEHGALPAGASWWACDHPERPSDAGCMWLENCAACRLAMATHVVCNPTHTSNGEPAIVYAQRVADRFDDDAMRRVLASV